MALKSRPQADYTFATFASILAWTYDRGHTLANPCEKPGKVYRGGRAESIWQDAGEAAFRASAPPRLWLAWFLAVWTGQRQGDLLRLTWGGGPVTAAISACARARPGTAW
ncbi:hypothetical protein HOY34_14905 [Xinfangfangia sp. D13-10-4-6]|uniref:hypothetical protein n=1 Tax=Pseudogemmobacter hezensis TaxID=2737662 RepID=UPI00155326C8|nr:hypothetical protein [Pseudogemmobacter hezensis]NPD16484.1 hypothetical protein [Pseudogemmobacter hezensis]